MSVRLIFLAVSMILAASVAFIAIGFSGPFEDGIVKELSGALDMRADRRGNRSVAADDNNYRTSVDKLYTAGDVRRGQSLVVWAIREGRQAAQSIDAALMGASVLPR